MGHRDIKHLMNTHVTENTVSKRHNESPLSHPCKPCIISICQVYTCGVRKSQISNSGSVRVRVVTVKAAACDHDHV